MRCKSCLSLITRVSLALAGMLSGVWQPLDAATAFSSDGEGTVYRGGDFRGDFTLTYIAFVREQPQNRAWSVLSVTMIGGKPPADAISVGLLPDAGGAHIYTSTTRRGKNFFRDAMVRCAARCVIGLRGNRSGIFAIAKGRTIDSWPRWLFAFAQPSIQLNAEVSTRGDRMDASLKPQQEVAGKISLGAPRCAFTTQGVVPVTVAGTLHFRGAFMPGASASYIELRSGRHVARCPA